MSPCVSFWDVSSHTPRSVLDATASFLFLFSGSSFFFFFFALADHSPSLICTWGPLLLAPSSHVTLRHVALRLLALCCVALALAVLPCPRRVALVISPSPSPALSHPHPCHLARALALAASSCRVALTLVMSQGCAPWLPPQSGSLHVETLASDLQGGWREKCEQVGGQGGVRVRAVETL